MKLWLGSMALASGFLALFVCCATRSTAREYAIVNQATRSVPATRLALPAPASLTGSSDETVARASTGRGPTQDVRALDERLWKGIEDLFEVLGQHPTLEHWERASAALIRAFGPGAKAHLVRSLNSERDELELLAICELARQYAARYGPLGAAFDDAFDAHARPRLIALAALTADVPGETMQRQCAMIAVAALGPPGDALALVARLDHATAGERLRACRALARSPHPEIAHALDERLRHGGSHEIESILITLQERAQPEAPWGANMAEWIQQPLQAITLDSERTLLLRQRALSALKAWSPASAAQVAESLLTQLEAGRQDPLARHSGRELFSANPSDPQRLLQLVRNEELEPATRLSLLEALADTDTLHPRDLSEELLTWLRQSSGAQGEAQRRAVYALAALDFPGERFNSITDLSALHATFQRARTLIDGRR